MGKITKILINDKLRILNICKEKRGMWIDKKARFKRKNIRFKTSPSASKINK